MQAFEVGSIALKILTKFVIHREERRRALTTAFSTLISRQLEIETTMKFTSVMKMTVLAMAAVSIVACAKDPAQEVASQKSKLKKEALPQQHPLRPPRQNLWLLRETSPVT